ncbi:phosphate acyltransferase PlsX [Agrilactobacillus fermenti]|uniref:phosphate acyltransferase PlsX n=1 Tax=Agrilactobacillus fermenti TaxID=2586909 RepID=UPI001E3E2DB1|nr:phosphate acyltransferase PlsX [Agrilactobacillus fermenti]MCD2256231.1 phosphate acyltransferase PlsX [Agrilactobacillus fermenti]
MKIAIDAMGGDNAPEAIVKGVLAARDAFSDMEFILYGDQAQIKPLVSNIERIEIQHTDEVIAGDDEPVRSVRRKKQASMVLAAQAVKDHHADAFFSCGNTGAVLACGIFVIGRIKGIERPGLMPTLPTVATDDGFNLIDAGANASSKPNHLYQYAKMGIYYAQDVRKIKQPRVGLLNNGTEYDKGDDLHKEAYQLLKDDPDINFIGNVEATNILEGPADVVVSDGFTGNAVLKTIEGTAGALMKVIKHSLLNSGMLSKLGAAMSKSAFAAVKDKFDTSKYGGAVLLGVAAPVVKSHGASDDRAVYYALTQIHDMVNKQTVQHVIDYFSKEKNS